MSKKPIPLAILSDSPDTPSGLGRITRDLAGRLYKSNLPVRVATFGFNGHGSRELPFAQYNLGPFLSSGDIPKLMPSWYDFTKGEQGILLTIYDLQRLECFRFSSQYGRPWYEFLGQEVAPFFLCGYLPIDSHAPRLMTNQTAESLRAFDRVIAYGAYGKHVLEGSLNSLGAASKPPNPNGLPHGIDTSTFKPQPKGNGRQRLRRLTDSGLKDDQGRPLPRTVEVGPDDPLVGIVMTNQMRKDWGSFFQIASRLPEDVKFWCHTDKLINFWSLPDLVSQYSLEERVFVTAGLDDEVLAELYSDCDLTLALGLGEGFGFPIVESMACGTPCLHVNYAGGADLLPQEMLVDPLGLRLEGPYCLQRPLIDAEEFTHKARLMLGGELEGFDCAGWVKERFDWQGLWRREWLPEFEALIAQYREWEKK